jgi:hypothetical protein
MSTLDRTHASILLNPDTASLKRIAWAFGCAKKGSDEERQLEALLREKLAKEAA